MIFRLVPLCRVEIICIYHESIISAGHEEIIFVRHKETISDRDEEITPVKHMADNAHETWVDNSCQTGKEENLSDMVMNEVCQTLATNAKISAYADLVKRLHIICFI